MAYRNDTRIKCTSGHTMCVTPQGESVVAEPIRIVGSQFVGTTVDVNFWTAATGTGGTVSQANGLLTISTGVTANNTASITSVASGRYIGGSTNAFRCNYILDGYHVGNKRRVGMYDNNNGFFWELDYQTVYAVARHNGTDTRVDITDLINLTNTLQKCEIALTNKAAEFYGDDGRLIYRMTAGSAPLSGSFQLPARAENINYGGATTNVPLKLTNMIIRRFGRPETQARYKNIKTAATTVCKYAPGTLHGIVVNGAGSTGNTAIIYDNTAGSGTIIATIDLAKTSVANLDYNVAFYNGLTIVTNSTVDITAIYE